MYMYGCLVNGVCVYGLAIVQAFGAIYMCTSRKTEQYHISNTLLGLSTCVLHVRLNNTTLATLFRVQ